MPDGRLTLWTLFVASALSVTIVLVAFGASLVASQRRRLRLERSGSRRVLKAQEEERARLAHELHDDVLQRVAIVHQELDALRLEADAAGVRRLSRRIAAVADEVRDLGEAVHAAAYLLHPSVVEKVGLRRAIGMLATEFRRTAGLRVDVTVPDSEPSLDMEVAVTAYRIVQEALRNVVKHALTDCASVALENSPDGITVRVTDTGAGFDATDETPHSGLGLLAMRYQAALADGSLLVSSRPGAGTIVTGRFPCRSRP